MRTQSQQNTAKMRFTTLFPCTDSLLHVTKVHPSASTGANWSLNFYKHFKTGRTPKEPIIWLDLTLLGRLLRAFSSPKCQVPCLSSEHVFRPCFDQTQIMAMLLFILHFSFALPLTSIISSYNISEINASSSDSTPLLGQLTNEQ